MCLCTRNILWTGVFCSGTALCTLHAFKSASNLRVVILHNIPVACTSRCRVCSELHTPLHTHIDTCANRTDVLAHILQKGYTVYPVRQWHVNPHICNTEFSDRIRTNSIDDTQLLHRFMSPVVCETHPTCTDPGRCRRRFWPETARTASHRSSSAGYCAADRHRGRSS